MEALKYITLNTFVKLQNLATTGGQAKVLIRSGEIKVNGEVDTRNAKKLHTGDVVEHKGKKFVVSQELVR